MLSKIDLIDPKTIEDNEYKEEKDYPTFTADKKKDLGYYRKVLLIQTAVDEQYLTYGGIKMLAVLLE